MEHKQLNPQNFFCHFCSLYGMGEMPADYLVWDKECDMAIPACDLHKDVVDKEKFCFDTFSLN